MSMENQQMGNVKFDAVEHVLKGRKLTKTNTSEGENKIGNA